MIRHICMNVRGALAQSDHELRSLIDDIEQDDEKCKSVQDVRQSLIEALGKGCKYIYCLKKEE